MEATILIVDDERSTRDGLRMALEDEFDCYVASDIREAMNILKSEKIDLVLTDLRMGGESGMDLLDKLLKLPNPPIAIMMTAYGSVDTAVEAMRRGAWHFVTKPLNLDEVELMIKRALRNKSLESNNQKLESENQELRKKVGKQPHGLEPLIGKSPAMAQIHAMITQIAPTKATVLIEGESGTGKEVVANAIHSLSGRPKEKIITVNCAALSPQLLESELFGHEKGAFTGANQKRIGRFEQANGGTLFLDEIGEIDQATQVKLLRVLSERTIERVGSNTPINIDVRVITATNKNLAKMVSKGDFREDLFFRLNVVKMTIPPLRERKEDIILLSNAFLAEFNQENNKAVHSIDESTSALLQHYDWPGNVRELKTAIEHGVVMCNGSTLESQHLPLNIQSGASLLLPSTNPSDSPEPLQNATFPAPTTFNLHTLETQTIQQALKHTNNNRTAAAELLGISRRTLQRKLKELEA
ncbi:sigma-54-dependent transcriptional regulator [Rubritalea tangerina]|uniref:Sigma-54-dependent transcriptional regulator n=1 Tax=Rubritalea tangerina TaxID=430798 RepID=A0ABW4Z7L5_9BACT